MLGNWSLGDYFKEEAIAYSYEFLTSPKWLGIEKDRLYFTCFAGDEDAPKDIESAQHWMSHGVEESHIFFLGKKHNWWGPAGMTGPCGPDTEMFIDTGLPACGPDCSPACSCGKYLEIWNDVFMQYNKTADGRFEPLAQKNVDTGMGLDRTICILQGKIRLRHRRLHRRSAASRSCPARATATTRTPRALSASSRTTCAAPPSFWATRKASRLPTWTRAICCAA